MTTEHIPCNQVVELLTDYLDRALDPVTAERVEAHLVRCPPCLTYLDQLRTTIRGVGALPVDTLPESTVAALESAFRGFHPPEAH
jgi:predicted anti-sigma-YlaC factor YlaD